MKELKNILKAAAKLAELRKAPADLDGLAARFAAEAGRLGESLEKIDARVLLKLELDGTELPADELGRLRRLNALREKINLIPGAKANAERKIAALEVELGEDYQEVWQAYRALARDRFDGELAASMERNLAACGGNPRRAMLAAKAAAEHSEARLWLEYFSMRESSGDLVGRIERMAERAARFEAGGPVRLAEAATAAPENAPVTA